MVTQHQRRGEDWLLKKGGFMRLIPEKNHNALLQPLSKGKLTIEMVQNSMQNIQASDQMLLLNLLGGRLPLGYRLIGTSIDESKQNITARLDRLLRRIRRVGTMIEEVLTTGDERGAPLGLTPTSLGRENSDHFTWLRWPVFQTFRIACLQRNVGQTSPSLNSPTVQR